MKQLVLLFFVLFIGSTNAELRTWTISTGQKVEATYIAVIGNKVILRGKNKKKFRIPFTQLSKQDCEYIELLNPPKLKLDLSKTTKQRVFPQNMHEDEPPKAQYMTFYIKIKQMSPKIYNHKMTVEYFAFGKEINGNKKVFLGHEICSFKLQGCGSTFSHQGITYELPKYHLKVKNAKLAKDEEWLPFRGVRYNGYLLIVKDENGKRISYKSTSKIYLSYIDKLRKLHAGCFFNPKTGERTTPTRPPHFPVMYQ